MIPRYPHSCTCCTYLGEFEEYDLYYCKNGNMSISTVIARHGVDGEYLSGMEFGTSGMIYPLAVALARAKERNLFKEPQELVLLPEAEKDIYLVMGHTGTGQDIKTWPVRAFRDIKTAQIFAAACREKAELWKNSQRKSWQSPPHNWSLLDPKMMRDEATFYHVTTIPISVRPEEISSHWEMCPICRGQVYDTPDGRICENGHEAI